MIIGAYFSAGVNVGRISLVDTTAGRIIQAEHVPAGVTVQVPDT